MPFQKQFGMEITGTVIILSPLDIVRKGPGSPKFATLLFNSHQLAQLRVLDTYI